MKKEDRKTISKVKCIRIERRTDGAKIEEASLCVRYNSFIKIEIFTMIRAKERGDSESE